MMMLPAWFDRASNVLVSVSLIEFTISTAVTEGGLADALAVVAIALRVLFAAEYIARFFVAGRPLRYAASVVGVLDLAAVVFDEGALKMLRALKVLAREVAVRRLWRAVVDVKGELAAAAACSVVLIYGSAVVMWLAEREAQPEVFGVGTCCAVVVGRYLDNRRIRGCLPCHGRRARDHCGGGHGGARHGSRTDGTDRVCDHACGRKCRPMVLMDT